jgi:hypothetical protein
MVWQLRMVAFLTGLMMVALMGGATWGCWAGRPRSRQEARERRARIRRINRKEEEGYVSRDDLIGATIIGSWLHILVAAGLTVVLAVFFARVAFGDAG